LFDRKLERLKSRPHAEDAIKILQLCGVAKRPLTTDEIREALTIKIGQKSLDFSSLSNDIGQIIADCCGLVYVEEEDASIHYVHHSVYQHLFKSTQPDSARFNHMVVDKHVGLLCLTYINFTDFKRQLVKVPKGSDARIDPWRIGATAVVGLPETSNRLALRLLRNSRRSTTVTANDLKRTTEDLLGVDENARLQSELKLRRFQFLLYARKYWIFHLAHLNENDDQKLWQVFCKCVDGTISIVDRPWETLGPAVQTDPIWKARSRSDVRWLVCNHHTALLVWKIIESHSTLTNKELGDLLLHCSRDDDVCMMKALIGHTQLTRYQVSVALVACAGCGSRDGVETLLAAGARTDDRWNGRTALQAAAGGGHVDVVDRLLAAKADVNAAAAEYGDGRTALQAAAEGGHHFIVQRLKEMGAN
jgi:hypothetical protein